MPEPSPQWPHEPLRSALVDALRRCVSAGGDDETITAAVVRCAREARAAGLKSEQLVVALRELWHDTSDRRLHSREGATAPALTRLIDIALTAYHRDD